MIEGAGFEVAQQHDWKLPLDFNAIRSLLGNAPQEVRGYFQIAEDGSFTSDAALIEAI
jgi:hypothetical protein